MKTIFLISMLFISGCHYYPYSEFLYRENGSNVYEAHCGGRFSMGDCYAEARKQCSYGFSVIKTDTSATHSRVNRTLIYSCRKY